VAFLEQEAKRGAREREDWQERFDKRASDKASLWVSFSLQPRDLKSGTDFNIFPHYSACTLHT